MKPTGALIALTLLTAACSHNSSTVTPNQPPTFNLPPLSRFVELDTTLAAPRDTIGRGFITRDAQQRPKLYDWYEFNINGDTTYWHQIQYIYAGATDSVASQFIEKSRSGATGPIYQRTHTLSWNGGMLQRDTVQLGTTGIADRFTYSPGMISWVRSAQGNPMVLYDRFYQTWSGDDLTYQLDTLRYPTGPNGMSVQNERTEVTTSYLSANNPFYDIARPIYWHGLFDDYRFDFWLSAPRHLIQQRVRNSSSWSVGSGGSTGSGSNTTTYRYIFNQYGMPYRVSETTFGSTPRARVLLLAYE